MSSNPDDSGAAKTDPRDPTKAVGLYHGLLYAELVDAPGMEDDTLVVRSYFTPGQLVHPHLAHPLATQRLNPMTPHTPSPRPDPRELGHLLFFLITPSAWSRVIRTAP